MKRLTRLTTTHALATLSAFAFAVISTLGHRW
jgi:hypothetical protein